MEYFAAEDHIIRKIWGKADTILLIFAGAAAEFALNKAVDWLYFTGKLPADPLGRLFSTVGYARQIIFADKARAHAAIDRMRQIHTGVETARGASIPDWAYRDVLFMLIHYSIASFEVLDRKLTPQEKEDVFAIFYKVGYGMQLKELPENYDDWKIMYAQQLQTNLEKSHYTIDLYKQYKKHLGAFRYFILIETQKLVVSKKVLALLHFNRPFIIQPFIFVYKIFRRLHAEWFVQSLILPDKYKQQVKLMNAV